MTTITTIASISALRALTVTTNPQLYLQGYVADGDGGQGNFYYDPTDTTSSDNGGTIIVDAAGHRWKRDVSGPIHVRWFGAKCDGATDDAAAFQAALDAAKAAMITSVRHDEGVSYIGSSLNIPGAVELSSGRGLRAPRDAQHVANYNYGGVISLNPTATLHCSEPGAALAGFCIMAHGIALPATRAQVNAWTGLAVSIDAACAGSEVRDNYVIGFAVAIDSPGNTEKVRIENNAFDCIHGIFVTDSHDVSHVHRNHGYPFASIALAPPTDQDVKRGGVAYRLTNCEFTQVTSNFAFGWTYTFWDANGGSNSFISCSADNTSTDRTDTPVAFYFLGGTAYACMIGCTASAGSVGVQNAIASTLTVTGCRFWNLGTAGIEHQGGWLTASANYFENMPYALTNVSSDGFSFDGNVLSSIYTAAFTSSAGQALVGQTNVFANTAAATIGGAISIASANALQVPSTGVMFEVTGTTTVFAAVSSTWPGRTITLWCANGFTVIHNGNPGTTTNILLNGSTNYAMSAGDTLVLQFRGDLWVETGRANL